jgi:hypothetical protein
MSEKKLCFVIGPIGDPGTDERSHADWLFDGIIKPVFAEHFRDKFEVPVRADQIVAPGSINTQVIARLFEVPLAIADLSLHNANAGKKLVDRLSTKAEVEDGKSVTRRRSQIGRRDR